jgi:hypothetical protein
MIDVPGSRISLTRALEMSYGFLLGPFIGPLTSFVGALVGNTLSGGTSFLYTPLALISTFIAAVLARNNFFGIRGWMIGAIVDLVLIMGWYITPVGYSIPYYPIPHLIGLLVMVLLGNKIHEYLNSKDRRKLILGALLASYPSTMAGHMAGNLIFIQTVNPSAAYFISLLPISIIERLTITAISTALAAPLLLMTREVFPDLFEKK